MRTQSRTFVGRVLVSSLSALAIAGCSSVQAGDPSSDGSAPRCAVADDCPSRVCNVASGTCEAPSCSDGVKNGGESDLDCGGACAPCDLLKSCNAGSDCTTGACRDVGSGLACQPPSPADGVKNGSETDVDCGGASAPKCAVGKGCAARADCQSDYCKTGICTPVTPSDGIQNGSETDIDCGGEGAPGCGDGKKCLVESDCTSIVCKDKGDGLRCQAPRPDDGKKNGTETDVDCGGASAPKCTVGKSCLAGADCASAGCNYASKCAGGRSCTRHYGGDTCGRGGEAGIAADWEDCCATSPVQASTGPTANVSVKVGKYVVTAGRMRAFLEDVSYDVRAFVRSARTAGKIPLIPGNASRRVLEADWDMYLPTSFTGNTNADEIADCSQSDVTTGTTCKPNTNQPGIYTAVSRHLGGFIFKANGQGTTGCYVGSPGTHAFRFPDAQQDGPAPQLNQDDYDTKSMQCVDYLMAQAFCVWDGGRLELVEEWLAAWGPGALPWSAVTEREPIGPGTNSYWGCRVPWASDADQSNCGTPWDATKKTIEYAAHNYSYEYPKLLNTDYIVFIPAPGRTRGRGPAGHADVIGNNFEMTSNVTYNASPFSARHGWTGNGSWEGHSPAKASWGSTMLLNKYGKVGFRCAYP